MIRPDILVFMSDQHSPIFSSYLGGIAKTPNMEQLCKNGTVFSAAYTSCPLCVPARMSMLLGKLPSNTGIFTNNDAIPERNATFLHSMVDAGYETVLIGRMHFVGGNQRHGFTKRLVGDITPVTWIRPAEKIDREIGAFKKCFAEPGCLTTIGGGNSPVLEFDKDVVQAALDYLAESHQKPQCIVVGTYGPHFPYAAPPELYLYYKERVEIPRSYREIPGYLPPFIKQRVQNISEDTVIKARSAYFGMIEVIDNQLGQVRDAFNKYLDRNERKGLFAYISDHGDQIGDRGIFGKMTFFENSAKIPMIFEGFGVRKGQSISSPVSIIDLGPTLCEVAGTTPPPRQDGRSLVPVLAEGKQDQDRSVFSEILVNTKNEVIPGRMVRKGNLKYITYSGYEEYDMLFDIQEDPEEIVNLANDKPAAKKELRRIALENWNPERILEDHHAHSICVKLIRGWEREIDPSGSERWNKNPECARKVPEVQ